MSRFGVVEICVPPSVSPQLGLALEYSRTLFGLPFSFRPGATTPNACPGAIMFLSGVSLMSSTKCLTKLADFPAKQESLEISVWFYLERPAEDFVNKTRYGGRLKPDKALMRLAPVKPDVDNLAKFVLDAMTGVVYGDDKQVVTLHLMKLRDNIGECRGGTYIRIKEII